MDAILSTTVKVTKCKLKPFQYIQSMSKRPTGSVYIGNIIYYPIYLPDPLPNGLEVDLGGSSIFPILMLSLHVDRLSLFNHLIDIYSAILLCDRVAGLALQPFA